MASVHDPNEFKLAAAESKGSALKILQVGASLDGWSGIEKYIANLSTSLSEQGHYVRILASSGTPLSDRGYSERFNAPFQHRRWKNLPWFVRAMKSEPFDIVNSHYSPDFFVAGAAARICKVPNYVITRHLAIPWPKQKGRLLAQFATQFVAVSGAVEEALARSGIPSERIEMIWVGIDEQPLTMTREQARDSMGIEPDEIAIGFVGRLIKEKGPDVLLAVAKETERRIHVIGDGEYAKVFQQKVAYEGASNLIRMHGYRSDIGNVLNAFDVFLAPSLWDDAFPAAVIEAMYFSKPIIASKVGGIPEMLDFGSAGLLVEPRDIKSWAAQLERLIGSSSVRSEYGERAKARQVQNYSRQTMARTYEKLYLRLQDR